MLEYYVKILEYLPLFIYVSLAIILILIIFLSIIISKLNKIINLLRLTEDSLNKLKIIKMREN